MHDYVKGAFEALSWVRMLLQEKGKTEEILKEIDSALEDVKEGVAIDFRRRLLPTRS